MKNCPNCQAPLEDNAEFCSNCGAPLNGQPAYQAAVPYVDPWDHTGDYDAKDISDNKIFAMTSYLLSVLGIVIALLAAQKSEYVMFHVRQALRFTIVELLVGLASLLLCWTVIAPFAGFVMMIILLVARIMAFVDVCKGKVRDPWLIRSLTFLR